MSEGERIEGQKIEGKRLEQLQQRIEQAPLEAPTGAQLDDADANARKILETVHAMWQELGFSPEQAVHAIATVTIHMRETCPLGKEGFDFIAHAARQHYNSGQ